MTAISLPFGPDTVSWRIDLEPVVVLGGGRAVLLQVAHPLVAAGVEQHSAYEHDPYGRLFGTLDVMTKLVFGTPDISRRQTAILAGIHRTVTGRSDDGIAYSAQDPALLVWVWATLVDTAVVMYEAIFGRLSSVDLDTFYAEQRLVAAGCGVPDGAVPATRGDFDAYLGHTIASTLRVTPAARAVAANILSPPLPWYLRPARYPANLVTTGLLPGALRSGYGLDWDRGRERALRATLAVLRATVPHVPRRLRQRPLLSMAGPQRARPPSFLR